ncbi:hypothetical protein [Fibrella forsythiae]|uniref:CopG family transcriptional regulator n=1 Tax=Fibrella forsythiae TaxID=2817061 RepID=A0ABS3JSI1_9BACT|nr:hypothetical protein [Fibrella forsythiae]MBO0952960.1 hypothetical protein [Fibrella forsythiae]
MATSLPPPRKKQPTEAEIEAIINRGGAVAPQGPEIEPTDRDKPKFFNVRLSVGIFQDIDRLRARRPRKPGSPKMGVSTHDWIVEAVLEKLRREDEP